MFKGLHTLQKDLRMGRSNRVIASSALLSVILFFYFLNLTSFFQPTVYPLIDRVTYVTGFVDKYFTNERVDSLIIVICTILWFQLSIGKNIQYFLMTVFGISIFLSIYFDIDFMRNLIVLVTVPVIFLIIITSKIQPHKPVSFDWRLLLNYISLFGIAIASLSAFLVISYIIFPQVQMPSMNYLYYFFLILSIFSPLYLIVISFAYPFNLLCRKFREILNKRFASNGEDIIFQKKHIKKEKRIFHLSVIIILSITISMIPHIETINKDDQVIGSDTKHYVKFLDSMTMSTDYVELFYKAFVTIIGGDRPLSLLFFFLLSSLFYQGNFTSSLENLPLLLSPLLVISTYFLTFRITKDHFTSVLASFITIPSHILIGIYAGLFANWFSLIWGYLVILFLIKLVDEPKRINFFIFSTLLIILLLCHAPTWTIFMYIIGLFLAVIFFKDKKSNSRLVAYAFLSMLPSIAIDITRMILLNNSGVAQEVDFVLNREVGIHGIYTIWSNLIDTTHLIFAGQVANPIILLLVIYWLYKTKIKDNFSLFIIIFFSLFVLPLLFAEKDIQSRFFYEIPLQIPAAIAITVLRERTGSLLSIAVCLWLVVMSAYMAANFVLVMR